MTEPILTNEAIHALAQTPGTAFQGQPPAADVARFERLSGDGPSLQYVESTGNRSYSAEMDTLVKKASELGREMQTHLEPSKTPIDTEQFPELAYMQEMFDAQRHFVAVNVQFQFVNKVVDSTAKGVQTLYKQQG